MKFCALDKIWATSTKAAFYILAKLLEAFGDENYGRNCSIYLAFEAKV
jgi:hypothetical protein